MVLMINEVAKIGELVYIPSEVLMTNYKEFIKTERPVNVLCVAQKSGELQVVYNGSSWWVNTNKVYAIKEEHGSQVSGNIRK